MAILSPLTEFSLKMSDSFPAPSEKEKLNKLIANDSKILRDLPHRADIGELKFRLADALVGRNSTGDYERALAIYEEILKNYTSPYLRARAQIGKAELMTPGIRPEKIDEALSLCQIARKNIKSDLSDFFMAKTYIVEAELRLVRDNKKEKDHEIAMKLHSKLIKTRSAHWYFKARALLGKAELILYHYIKRIPEALRLCERVERLLADRKGDYFFMKNALIKAQLIEKRGRKTDTAKAEAILKTLVKNKGIYPDLDIRAKLELAEISQDPCKYIADLESKDGLDPYTAQKLRMLEEEQTLKC